VSRTRKIIDKICNEKEKKLFANVRENTSLILWCEMQVELDEEE
jgi:hypothetical protein